MSTTKTPERQRPKHPWKRDRSRSWIPRRTPWSGQERRSRSQKEELVTRSSRSASRSSMRSPKTSLRAIRKPNDRNYSRSSERSPIGLKDSKTFAFWSTVVRLWSVITIYHLYNMNFVNILIHLLFHLSAAMASKPLFIRRIYPYEFGSRINPKRLILESVFKMNRNRK